MFNKKFYIVDLGYHGLRSLLPLIKNYNFHFLLDSVPFLGFSKSRVLIVEGAWGTLGLLQFRESIYNIEVHRTKYCWCLYVI